MTKRGTQPADRVRLVLFGTPRVTRGGEAVTFDTRKAYAVLARVAVAARPVPRESLAALLWPDADEERARSSLRRTLSVTGAVGPALVVDRSTVTLDRTLADVDVTEFDRLALADDRVGWAAAVDLARDPFLAGFALRDAADFDDWQAENAASYLQRTGRLLDRLVQAESEAGELDLALDHARRRLALDPLHEPAHQAVMRLLSWMGDRAGAMNQFRACTRVLDRELGVGPLPETRELYDRVRDDLLTVPHPPVVVAGPVPDPPRPAPPARPSLVGRDAVLARIRASRGAAGTGAVAAVVGDAGSGRTAVLDIVAEEAVADGAPVVRVRGHDAERSLALGVVSDLVRRTVDLDPDSAAGLGPADLLEVARFVPVPGLTATPPPLDSPGARARSFDAVVRLVALVLGSGPGTGLLVVDDAHWLDPASEQFLGYLARRCPAGVLVLMSWRASAPPTSLTGADVDHVTVGPLDEDDALALLADLGTTVDDRAIGPLLRRTGGSPRLLREYALAAAGGADVPSVEIDDLVVARLGSAPETTRQLVTASAILALEADPDLLRLTSGRAETEVVDALEDAVERGLLAEISGSGSYDIPYDRMRTLVLARTSQARRRLLHGRAADALVARSVRDPRGAPSAAIAAHLAHAGRADEAAAWHRRAADEARALWAHEEALHHLDTAVTLGSDPVDGHRAAGEALIALGRYADALGSLERAASFTDDPAELAEIEHLLADVHHRLGSFPAARAHLESTLRLLGPGGSSDAATLRARTTADLALVQFRQGELEAAAVTAAAAERDARATGDEAALAQAYDVLGVLAAARGDHDLARAHLRASLDRSAALADPGTAVAALNNLALVEHESGDEAAALDAALRALVLGERHGDRHRLAALHTNLADLLHAAGRHDEAIGHLTSAAQLFAEVDRDSERRPEIWKLVAW